MDRVPPGPQQWREIVKLARDLYELRPWDWMYETDLFGVEIPETKEVVFSSFLGGGNFLSLALYPGWEGLMSYFALEAMGAYNMDSYCEEEMEFFQMNPEEILQVQRCLMINYSPLDQLEDRDRKALSHRVEDLSPEDLWPVFRNYRPSYLPWYIDSEEARVFRQVLPQIRIVAEKMQEDLTFLQPPEKDLYLCRYQSEGESWQEEWREFPPGEEEGPPEIGAAVDEVKSLKAEGIWEMDLINLYQPQREGEERPYFPFLLLMAERGEEGRKVSRVLSPGEVDDQLEEIALQEWKAIGHYPREIRLQSEWFCERLLPLAQALEMEVEMAEELASIEEIKAENKREE